MWCIAGWLVAMLLLGYILGTRARRERLTLRMRCGQIRDFRGRHAAELTALLGGLAQDMRQTRCGCLRTWREHGFEITLSFDEKDVCLGVHEERG